MLSIFASRFHYGALLKYRMLVSILMGPNKIFITNLMKIKIFHILFVLDYPGAAASLSSPSALIENLQADLEHWKRYRMEELSREENKRGRKKAESTHVR